MSYASIKLMNVDTHFHIFDKNTSASAESRYSVNYSARIEEWLHAAHQQGVTKGVIVQPSFLGFDNSLILETIQQNPTLFKGVGAVDPNISSEELFELSRQGIRGIRLNLYGSKDPFETLQKYTSVIGLLNGLNMHLQIHHDDGLLNELLLAIPSGTNIVVDHFGRPKTDDEFEKLNTGICKHQNKLWVKLSAQYRTPNIDHQNVFQYWLNTVGQSRLLWGSDWPHTRFEGAETYRSQIDRFQALNISPDLKHQILCANPEALYWT